MGGSMSVKRQAQSLPFLCDCGWTVVRQWCTRHVSVTWWLTSVLWLPSRPTLCLRCALWQLHLQTNGAAVPDFSIILIPIIKSTSKIHFCCTCRPGEHFRSFRVKIKSNLNKNCTHMYFCCTCRPKGRPDQGWPKQHMHGWGGWKEWRLHWEKWVLERAHSFFFSATASVQAVVTQLPFTLKG